MKLLEMSKEELEELERTLAYLIDDYGKLTVQELHDKIGEILEPEEGGGG